MPDWGAVLGSGYDAFFDRKDKNREFQLRKQQEDALNTLRQIQIEDALKKQQIQAAVLAGQQGLKGQPTAEGLLKMGAIDNQSSDPRVMQQYGRGQIPQGYPEGMLTTPTLEQRYKQYAKDDPIGGLSLMSNYETKEAALELKKELANMANNTKLAQIEAANQRARDLLEFRKGNRTERGVDKSGEPKTQDSEKLRKQNIAELEKHLKIYEPILKKYQGVDISLLDENSKKQYENYRRGYNKTLETLDKIKNREINNVTWGAYNPNNPEQNTPQQPSKVIRFNSKGERI